MYAKCFWSLTNLRKNSQDIAALAFLEYVFCESLSFIKVQYYMAGLSLYGKIIENSSTSFKQELLIKIFFLLHSSACLNLKQLIKQQLLTTRNRNPILSL